MQERLQPERRYSPTVAVKRPLAEWRKIKGLTQEDLGALVGLSQSTIAMYESGRRTPNVRIATAIAEKLGVMVDEIDFTPRIERIPDSIRVVLASIYPNP